MPALGSGEARVPLGGVTERRGDEGDTREGGEGGDEQARCSQEATGHGRDGVNEKRKRRSKRRFEQKNFQDLICSPIQKNSFPGQLKKTVVTFH